MNSIIWQGINGFLTTIIIGAYVWFVSSRWLDKRERLNAEQGIILNKRVDVYMDLLDIMASFEGKKIIMDAKYQLRDEMDKNGFVLRRDGFGNAIR